jgi:hypothetical protein
VSESSSVRDASILPPNFNKLHRDRVLAVLKAADPVSGVLQGKPARPVFPRKQGMDKWLCKPKHGRPGRCNSKRKARGRKLKLSKKQIFEVSGLYTEPRPVQEIADLYGVSRPTIYRAAADKFRPWCGARSSREAKVAIAADTGFCFDQFRTFRTLLTTG